MFFNGKILLYVSVLITHICFACEKYGVYQLSNSVSTHFNFFIDGHFQVAFIKILINSAFENVEYASKLSAIIQSKIQCLIATAKYLAYSSELETSEYNSTHSKNSSSLYISYGNIAETIIFIASFL
jgi:hypothetical protein